MKDLFIYLLEVNVYLLLFFLLYLFLLKRESFFGLNRFYILFSSAISFILPLINFLPASLEIYTYQLPLINVADENVVTSSTGGINWLVITAIIYISGALFRTTLFVRELLKINRLGKLSLFKREPQLFEVDETVSTASFLNNIYLNTVLDKESKEIVLIHETIHCRQKHSLDIIWMNILKIVCWFNPIVNLMEWRIKELHEYLVDREMIGKTVEKEKYCGLLIGTALHINPYILANHLSNYKLLKNRIAMMTTKNNSKIAMLKYLSLIPLTAIGIFLISCNKSEDVKNQNPYENAPVHSMVEQMPEFPGGEDALFAYLGENIKYPESAKEENVEGTSYISFIVRPDGSIDNVKDKRSPDKRLSDEAVRVIENMPNWKPGEKDGEKVSVEYMLPVQFKLNDSQNPPAVPEPETPPVPQN